MHIKLKGNKSLAASIVAIIFALAMTVFTFNVILPIDSDVLQVIFFIIMFLPMKMFMAKKLGVDTSESDKVYEEMDSRMKIKKNEDDEG